MRKSQWCCIFMSCGLKSKNLNNSYVSHPMPINVLIRTNLHQLRKLMVYLTKSFLIDSFVYVKQSRCEWICFNCAEMNKMIIYDKYYWGSYLFVFSFVYLFKLFVRKLWLCATLCVSSFNNTWIRFAFSKHILGKLDGNKVNGKTCTWLLLKDDFDLILIPKNRKKRTLSNYSIGKLFYTSNNIYQLVNSWLFGNFWNFYHA